MTEILTFNGKHYLAVRYPEVFIPIKLLEQNDFLFILRHKQKYFLALGLKQSEYIEACRHFTERELSLSEVIVPKMERVQENLQM